MLYTQTIDSKTLELLKMLMADPMMSAFRLVGGTALSLRIGHRKSVDIDLFTQESFDESKVRMHLENKYCLKAQFVDVKTLKGEIDGVQIDCIAHEYPWVEPFDEEDGVRLASLQDICAMKLNAIAGNGTRIKDFIDIAYLSRYFSFNQMLGFYQQKYNANVLIPVKAVTFFDDINLDEPIWMLNGELHWKNIEQRILQMVQNPETIIR